MHMSKKFSINSDSKKFVIQNSGSSQKKNILGNTIRKASSDSLVVDPDLEQLLILDEKNGKLSIHKGNRFHRFRSFGNRKYTHFLVDFSEFSSVKDLNCQINNSQEGTTTSLSISFELSIIKGKALTALRFFKNEPNNSYHTLQKYFINWTRNFSAQHSSLSTDFFSLEYRFRSYLINQLEEKGLRIRNVQFNPIYSRTSQEFPQHHITIVHRTKCEIQDDYIEVKSKIVLNLINRRAFAAKYIANPEKWIREKTDAIIQNELINKSFKDIIDEFDFGLKENIVATLERAIDEIGYSVEHIISIPSEEIAEFLSGFTFNLGNSNTFETNQSEIKVKISGTIEAKGTTLAGIDRKYIKPRKSIIDEVKQQTIDTIAAQLRQIDPETYYQEFNTIRNSIKREVKAILFEKFSLDPNDFKFSLSYLKTDLMERFDWLFAERGTFSIESNSSELFYEITYGVRAVKDWYVFQKNHIKYHGNTILEYQDISRYLKNAMELDIKRFTDTLIDDIDSKSLDQGIVKLFTAASPIISEEFGLQLKTPRIKRVRKRGDNIFLVETYNKKRKQIERELSDAVMAEDEELIHTLQRQLKKLKQNLKTALDSDSSLLNGRDLFNTKLLSESGEEE